MQGQASNHVPMGLSNLARRAYGRIDLGKHESTHDPPSSFMKLLLRVTCYDPSDGFVSFDKGKLVRLVQLYSDDFSTKDIEKLSRQLDTYILDVREDLAFHNINGISGLSQKLMELK